MICFSVKRREVVAAAALSAVIVAGLLQDFGTAVAALAGYMVFTMTLVVFIDLRHLIIPDIFSLPAIPLGLATNWFVSGDMQRMEHLMHGLLAATGAAGVLYGIRFIYMRLRGIEGVGLGDVKLAAAAGAWVGVEGLAMTSLVATTAALLVTAARSARVAGGLDLRTAVPFGSFLAPAIIVVWLLQLTGSA